MGTTVLLQAFDAKGNLLDISGKTLQELYDGADNTVTFDFNELGSAGKILEITKTLRSGMLWDFDSDNGKKARIAYFQLRILGAGLVSESWITPWGRHCRVTLTGHVTNV